MLGLLIVNASAISPAVISFSRSISSICLLVESSSALNNAFIGPKVYNICIIRQTSKYYLCNTVDDQLLKISAEKFFKTLFLCSLTQQSVVIRNLNPTYMRSEEH